MRGEVRCLVLVVKGVDSGENLERWQFNVETTRDAGTGRTATQAQKSQKEITQEIQAIIRQITASVTFLPLLNEPCCFDLLIYTGSLGCRCNCNYCCVLERIR
jgi:mitotic spindle assembly checkpoint protein MAD2